MDDVLILDTDTTGLPGNWSIDAIDLPDNWPHLVQIAWVRTRPPEFDGQVSVCVVRPDGWTIPAEVSAVHGITQEIALRDGWPLASVLAAVLADCDGDPPMVAHNASFDRNVCVAALARGGCRAAAERVDETIWHCSMQRTTDLVRLPGGPRGFKWPKLHELYWYLFRSQPAVALHRADADVTTLAACLRELWKTGRNLW